MILSQANKYYDIQSNAENARVHSYKFYIEYIISKTWDMVTKMGQI